MAGSVNMVFVVGYLGADPEVKYTPSGKPVANMSVATSESWKDDRGAKQERTEWHRIVVWGDQAEACGKYLAKGRLVAVQGKLQTRSWEKDGQKRYTTEIRADRVTFLGSAGGDREDRGDRQQERTGGSHRDEHDQRPENDDIPF